MSTTTAKVPTEVQKPAFQRKTTDEELARLFTVLEDSTAKLTEALNTDNLKAQAEAAANNDKALKEYNNYAIRVAYEGFLLTPVPMKTALKAGYIALKNVTVRDDLGMKTASVGNVERQIDFSSFNTYCHALGAKVLLAASQMGYVVFMEKSLSDGKDAAALTKVYQSSKGRTVTKVLEAAPSMNEKKRTLQDLIDEIYFEDCGTGKNRFMVTKEWISWFEDHISITGYKKGSLYRQSRTPKDIIQTACALYHAYYNKYGIDAVGDKEHVLRGETNKELLERETVEETPAATVEVSEAPAAEPQVSQPKKKRAVKAAVTEKVATA